jgi:hypothetical protein
MGRRFGLSVGAANKSFQHNWLSELRHKLAIGIQAVDGDSGATEEGRRLYNNKTITKSAFYILNLD